MKHFSIQSLVIGIGMGMIITSSINILHNGQNDINILDNNENSLVVNSQDNRGVPIIAEESHKKPYENAEKANNINNEENKTIKDQEYIEIFIKKGLNSKEIAKILEEKKIIDNSDDFLLLAKELKVTNLLRHGFRKIPVNSSLEEIIEILMEIQ
ncbi:hypothetical protein [Natronincola ferrireducens]|uniref:YceG-like family protein n=1 Tax=Natronincola ferrireducens TaxID=393762 RepID=A0A1G9C4Z6_9FIRM|nr:hypothetical protein [Natronincola ferrireducens]SDK46425.1 hypothetical protein SAMN05660472_01357 [Natronincola ferrireducens]